MRLRPVTLNQLREEIDVLDSEIIMLLAKRMRLSSAIGEYKAKRGIAPRDDARWQEVINSRIQQGKQRGLPSNLVQGIFDLIHTHSLLIQQNPQ